MSLMKVVRLFIKRSQFKVALILALIPIAQIRQLLLFTFAGVPLFTRKHRRSPSHCNLKYGRENSPPESPTKEVVHFASEIESKEGLEVS